MVPIVLHVMFKRKKRVTLALPALPEVGQWYEREKRRRWKESKDSCDPPPRYQARSEYLTASPDPTNTCSNQ